MDIELLKVQMEVSYFERKYAYDRQVEEMRIMREDFYRENPDFPIKTMFMNVCAPPMRIEFKKI